MRTYSNMIPHLLRRPEHSAAGERLRTLYRHRQYRKPHIAKHIVWRHKKTVEQRSVNKQWIKRHFGVMQILSNAQRSKHLLCLNMLMCVGMRIFVQEALKSPNFIAGSSSLFLQISLPPPLCPFFSPIFTVCLYTWGMRNSLANFRCQALNYLGQV